MGGAAGGAIAEGGWLGVENLVYVSASAVILPKLASYFKAMLWMTSKVK